MAGMTPQIALTMATQLAGLVPVSSGIDPKFLITEMARLLAFLPDTGTASAVVRHCGERNEWLTLAAVKASINAVLPPAPRIEQRTDNLALPRPKRDDRIEDWSTRNLQRIPELCARLKLDRFPWTVQECRDELTRRGHAFE